MLLLYRELYACHLGLVGYLVLEAVIAPVAEEIRVPVPELLLCFILLLQRPDKNHVPALVAYGLIDNGA